MWEELFESRILARGMDYFIRDFVGNVNVKEKLIKASVFGTEEYIVEIAKHNGEISDLSCTCPYAADGNNCKHMAAVLFYLDAEDASVKNIETEEKILELVEEADSSIIKNFLINILKNDTRLLNRFKIELQTDLSPTVLSSYKIEINNIFDKYSDYYDFVDYKNSWDFTFELQEFLNNDVQAMLNNNKLRQAFELSNYIFIKIANQDMDDSSGASGEVGSKCLDIWQEIVLKADIELKREIFTWCIDHLDGSIVDYMEEYIEDLIFADFKEEEFLNFKSTFLDRKLEQCRKDNESWFSKYKLAQLMLRHIQILEEKNVKQDIIDNYCLENLGINEIRDYYIDVCIKREDYDMAIKLLKEGKVEDKKYQGLVINYSLKLKDLYQEIGEYQLYEEELWALVLNYATGDVDFYKELKSMYTEKEWLEERERVFPKVSFSRDLAKLYALEGLYDRLMNVVSKSQGLNILMDYEESLKQIYPKELLNKYEIEVKNMAINTTGRSYYKEIVSVLRRMKKYPEGNERISEIINDWRIRYKNRPAMMDELNKL